MKVIPAGHRVLIKQDRLEEADEQFKRAAEWGFIRAQTEDAQRAQVGVDTGVILDIGFNAWKGFDGGEPWAKVGDRVAFAKYSGKVFRDTKGNTLLVVNDEDVVAIIGEDVNVD